LISLLETKIIQDPDIIDKIIKLLDNREFQLALSLAGSLFALKKIYNIYKKRMERRKYLGVENKKKKKQENIVDWPDIVHDLTDTDILDYNKK